MDRIDLNKFVQQIRDVFKESKLTWRYEQVSTSESVALETLFVPVLPVLYKCYHELL